MVVDGGFSLLDSNERLPPLIRSPSHADLLELRNGPSVLPESAEELISWPGVASTNRVRTSVIADLQVFSGNEFLLQHVLQDLGEVRVRRDDCICGASGGNGEIEGSGDLGERVHFRESVHGDIHCEGVHTHQNTVDGGVDLQVGFRPCLGECQG